MQDEKMAVLAEYNTITEAEISKSMLDSAGIWSTIHNEYMSSIYPIGTMQFKGLGFPNKYFATQKWSLYIRRHCLQQL